MSFLTEFLIYTAIAAFLQNVVFTRMLGTSRIHTFMNDPRSLTQFGLLIIAASTASSAAGYGVVQLFRYREWSNQWRPICFLVCMALVYIVLVHGLKFLGLDKADGVRTSLIYACFNAAVLGVMLITAAQGYNFARTLGFGFGTGVGFLLATLLIYSGHRRLLLSDVPKAFSGVPITFLYIGLVSLSIYGLIGHQLAS